MMVLEDDATSRFVRGVSARFPKPSAIIVISAHWETDRPTINGAAYPETIHDFGGFPQVLFDVQYPAPGNPALAERIHADLAAAGIAADIDRTRGIDHGVWSPLALMYPNADIPVVEISVQPDRDARWHYQLGRALSGLASENILVLATGNLTHNLREAFRGHHPQTPEWVSAFANWVAEGVERGDVNTLLGWAENAPYALKNHPTPEHFMPFFVALGAAGDDFTAERLNPVVAMGVLAMDAYAFSRLPSP